MTKIAVVECKTKNIGDDIQTLAALRFAPDAEFVRRDEIGDETRDLKIIGNAWWMEGDKYPRYDQHILPVSMHVWNDGMKQWFLNREHVYPVGCRDLYTLKLMESWGVPAYFSGCLTLTLPEYKGKRDGIVFVDRVPDEWKCDNATYVSHHNVKGNKWGVNDRLELAEKRLDLYRKAELVITKRLHVALPCLAMGTPVLVNDKVWASERFDGFNLPNVFKGYDPIEYKVRRPVKLIRELKDTVSEFVK